MKPETVEFTVITLCLYVLVFAVLTDLDVYQRLVVSGIGLATYLISSVLYYRIRRRRRAAGSLG